MVFDAIGDDFSWQHAVVQRLVLAIKDNLKDGVLTPLADTARGSLIRGKSH